jgi:general secretion pathway protein I
MLKRWGRFSTCPKFGQIENLPHVLEQSMALVSPTSRRQGLSLLEVLVALAVFLMALVALGTLSSMGGKRALNVDETNLATQICQSKMNEVMAGSIPVNGSSGGSVDEYPGWEWSMDSEAGAVTGLYTVTIRVTRQGSEGKSVGASLTQMVMDPALKGNNGAYSTTSSNSSTTGNSNNTGGN